MKIQRSVVAGWVLGLAVVGCGEPPKQEELVVPDTYTFPSRFTSGSSVVYTGQTLRQVLISDLKSHIGALTARIDTGGYAPAAGAVQAELEFFYNFKVDTSGDVATKLAVAPPLMQGRYKDIAPKGANLVSKIAGNDPVGQHQDWSKAFVGWNGAGSPDGLVRMWFQKLDMLAVDRARGVLPKDPSGKALTKVFVTAEGHDLNELLQKFLLGAVAFSQGADDYLDDDLDGQGLRVDNTAQDGTEPYTKLEHAWDEAFGYFGASRDFGKRTPEDVLAKAAFDSDGDGKVDVASEYTFSNAVYAARRDAESAPSAKTRFAAETFGAFLRGRAVISAAKGPLSEEQFAELRKQRDIAVSNWEKVLAASTVSYLNRVLQHMERFDTATYDFQEHAKHWSEMKGLALGLQFNPRSPLTDARFAELHAKLGQAPVLPNQAGVADYKVALREARELLRATYQFDVANMGDAAGRNGW